MTGIDVEDNDLRRGGGGLYPYWCGLANTHKNCLCTLLSDCHSLAMPPIPLMLVI